MAIAAALTLNHATDLFANTFVMHCLSLMHSRGNNMIYEAARFSIQNARLLRARIKKYIDDHYYRLTVRLLRLNVVRSLTQIEI